MLDTSICKRPTYQAERRRSSFRLGASSIFPRRSDDCAFSVAQHRHHIDIPRTKNTEESDNKTGELAPSIKHTKHNITTSPVRLKKLTHQHPSHQPHHHRHHWFKHRRQHEARTCLQTYSRETTRDAKMTRCKNSSTDKIEKHAFDPTLGDGRGKVPGDKISAKKNLKPKDAFDP